MANPDFIQKNLFVKKDSKSLFVLLPHWHGKIKNFWIVKNKIIRESHSFLGYEFTEEILSSDVDLTKRNFYKIKETVRSDIDNLVEKYNLKKINFIGVSLGSVLTLMIAREIKNIQKIILIATSYNLAESVWKGALTKNIRQKLESQGGNLENLKEAWKDLAPENNIKDLNAEKIYVEISKMDKIVPYNHGKKMVELFNKRNCPITLKENRFFGHALTLLKYMILPKI
jgi:hypothetical protein